MKKVWSKLLVVCMAAVLAVGVCFALTACDEGDVPTSTKYTYDSVDVDDGGIFDAMFTGATAYFENGQFVLETGSCSQKNVMDYTEEDGRYLITYTDELAAVFGEDVEMYVTFDDTTLTMTEIVGSTTINIVFKA